MDRRSFLGTAAALAVAPRAHAAAANVALVLGGGGCRGYAHIGVIRALEANGIRPDLVVGSSVGALVGALYAAGVGAAQLERIGERMGPNMLRDWIFPRLGVFSGAGIARFVRAQIGERMIESLPMRFAAVAADLRNGEAVILERGEAGTAVQASSSAPGLHEPVRLGGRLLVDGNLATPVPVGVARSLGAARVIAVDVTFPPSEAELEDPYDALYQGFSILTRKLALDERAQAEVVVEPPIPRRQTMSRETIREHIAAGERGALDAMPQIRKLFAR